MRVIATRTYRFTNGNEEFTIKNHEITDAPDWISETTLFKLAQKDKSISEITTKEQQVAAENTGTPTENTTEDKKSPAKNGK